MEIISEGEAVVGLRLQGQDFRADPDSGEVIVPKNFLNGFRLSEIPDDCVINPVEAVEGNVIDREHDISIGAFREGSAVASVEDMGRRKLWDGEVGFSKFMGAMRQAIRERHVAVGDVEETGFEDDEDYIFIWYDVLLSGDMPIEAAVSHVERVVGELEARRDRILSQRLDSLLGILDRGSFDIDVPHALDIAAKTGRTVALIMVDIDRFKAVNDTHGHSAGDAVLKGVAEIVRAEAAGKGEAYRYGGEELAVLLPSAGALEASAAAEAIRRAVEQTNFDAGVRVTVSCGVAVFPANGTDPNALVKAADEAVYEAKNAGRNVVKPVDK